MAGILTEDIFTAVERSISRLTGNLTAEDHFPSRDNPQLTESAQAAPQRAPMPLVEGYDMSDVVGLIEGMGVNYTPDTAYLGEEAPAGAYSTMEAPEADAEPVDEEAPIEEGVETAPLPAIPGIGPIDEALAMLEAMGC
jgi:hypothetical protein